MNEPEVLVWHKHRGRDGKAVIHTDGSCTKIVDQDPPRRSKVYEGSGSVGWVSATEGRTMRNEGRARYCESCM
jgi:hypothetical protein